MKITIIGTTSYQSLMSAHRFKLESSGHEVSLPAFDSHPNLDGFGVCRYNRDLILNSDEVHLFWDQRSMGTVFDFGMCFALGKPVKIIYMEQKTFRGVMEKYQESTSVTK